MLGLEYESAVSLTSHADVIYSLTNAGTVVLLSTTLFGSTQEEAGNVLQRIRREGLQAAF
jgi:hypothetical protein